MVDKDLADRLVELGILRKDGDDRYAFTVELPVGRTYAEIWKEPPKNEWFIASAMFAVDDWRVAGACLERMSACEIDTIGKPWWVASYILKKDKDGRQLPEKWHKAEGKSLPRTIIEAYIEAVSDEGHSRKRGA